MPRHLRRVAICLLALAPILFATRPAGALSEQEELLERSRLTFLKLIDHPDFPELKQYVHHAKALLIVPSLIKGGFFIGGEGGSGVLIARSPEGGWSNPAFYTLGAGSLGLQFGGLISGAFLTETVFGRPGLGRYVVAAIGARDFPVIQGTVLVVAVAFVLINLLVDIAYAAIDPRIHYS